ncbi:MAG: methylated-DNA--[protein]-cysteine S-methyltransferase [Alphaproteobacteria bacterium]|nr:methylated-DNA--[protein]-cysteine S-methyltransferase [Alphaproteobacteria bacterium]
MLASVIIDSPVGPLSLDEQDAAIVAIRWAEGGADTGGKPPTPLLAEAARQLAAYFAGRLSEFDLPLAPAGSAFEQRVWQAMSAIPYGETRCYGELAEATDSAPRAVGRACGRNPIPVVIPCHRVLARAGLGGYSGAGGLATKRALLALEGALPETPRLPFAAERVTPPARAAIVAPSLL